MPRERGVLDLGEVPEDRVIEKDAPAARVREMLDFYRELVAAGRWGLVGVMAGEGDEDPGPPFAYTVGFPEALGAVGVDAEVVIVGFTGPRIGFLNDLGEAIKAGTIPWRMNEPFTGLFYGAEGRAFPAKFVELGTWRDVGHVSVAAKLFRDPDRRVVQLLWSDAEGRLPGDAGCEESCAGQGLAPAAPEPYAVLRVAEGD